MAKCKHYGIKLLKPTRPGETRFKCKDCGTIWAFRASKDTDNGE